MDEMLTRIFDCLGTKHGAQKELAKYLGIHPNVITNWKNGSNKSYRGYIDEMAAYFGVSTTYLLYGAMQISSEHLLNGIHIYRNETPLGVNADVLEDLPEGSYDILVQRKHLIVALDKNSGMNDSEIDAKLQEVLGITPTNSNETTTILSSKEKRDIAADVKKIVDAMEIGGDLMFDGLPMSDEAKASLVAAMKIGLEEARKRNKETYTPKKFKEKE